MTKRKHRKLTIDSSVGGFSYLFGLRIKINVKIFIRHRYHKMSVYLVIGLEKISYNSKKPDDVIG